MFSSNARSFVLTTEKTSLKRKINSSQQKLFLFSTKKILLSTEKQFL